MFCSWRRSTLFFIDRIYNNIDTFCWNIVFKNSLEKKIVSNCGTFNLIFTFLLLVNGLAFFKNEDLIVSI